MTIITAMKSIQTIKNSSIGKLYHPWSGMTPRVLSIILWSAAAPVVLSSSRVDRSLK